MEINGYSEKATAYIAFPVGEVALSQDDPLSVDLTIFPELPTATNSLGFAEEELSDEDEVELSAVLVELSEELSGEPSTTTFHLISLHEETITAMLTIRTNQDNICLLYTSPSPRD